MQPEVTLQYLIFDFGKREGRVDGGSRRKHLQPRQVSIAANRSHLPDRVGVLRNFLILTPCFSAGVKTAATVVR